MTPDPLELTRIPAEAAEAAARAGLGKPALALLRQGATSRDFVEALARAEMLSDAIRFLAFGLPRREAVWWASLFVLWSGAGQLHADDARRLRAVARWVAEPTEEHRREAAEWEGDSSPSGLLARAVKRTGGSMLDPKYPVRPPDPEMTPRAVAAAITAAVLKGEAKELPLRQRQAVALGMHVARGHFPWMPPAAPRR